MSAIHELLGAWDSFYLILGSAAAALTGLQFVVMALIAESPEPASADTLNAYGTPTVVHFCQCLVLSALACMPWDAWMPLAWLIGATGGIGFVYTLIVLRRARRQRDYQPVLEDWIWHTGLPLLAYTGVVIGAVVLATHAQAAMFITAGAVLALVLIGIHNAWDSVAFVIMQRRSKLRD